MTKPIYSFKPGPTFNAGVSAQDIGETLEEIKAENDGDAVKPQQVVDKARPEDHPIHPCFQWDDWEAAEAYRRYQASTLIRKIEVQYPDKEETEPAFVHVTVAQSAGQTAQAGYMPCRVVAAQPDMLASALSNLRSDIAGLARTARALESMAQQKKAPQLAEARNMRIHLNCALSKPG